MCVWGWTKRDIVNVLPFVLEHPPNKSSCVRRITDGRNEDSQVCGGRSTKLRGYHAFACDPPSSHEQHDQLELPAFVFVFVCVLVIMIRAPFVVQQRHQYD